MKNIIEIIAIALGVIVAACFIGILGGTIVWILWPVAIPAAFPGLVDAGKLAAKLTWSQSVYLTWIFSILIKSSQTNNNKLD